MIIVPIRSAQSIREEVEWASRQPQWVQKLHYGFYVCFCLAGIAVVPLAIWIAFF